MLIVILLHDPIELGLSRPTRAGELIIVSNHLKAGKTVGLSAFSCMNAL